jgi:hypothetical protein
MPKKYKGKRDPIYNGAVAPLLYLVKAIMVLFVATFPKAHVLVVTSGAICTWPYHRGDSGGIANYTRFSHLCEYRVTITLPTRGPGVPRASPLL